MADDFSSLTKGLTGPASKAAAITPNDSTDLSSYTRGIYVGGSGNLTADLVDGGTNVLFANLAAGIVHPLRVKRVYSTGTTATGIVGLV